MNLKIVVPIMFSCLCFFACDRVKRKGSYLMNKTSSKIEEAEQAIINKKDSLVDKVFPQYDFDSSDTESNKKRF